jgi:hypothetical protein
MGLLQKAASVAPGKGLLQKSLEILSGREAVELPLQLTQQEVDRLFAIRVPTPPSNRKFEKLHSTDIPLTWSAAGLKAPPLLKASIDSVEFQKATRAKRPSHAGKGGKAAPIASKAAAGAARGADPTEGIISEIFALPQGIELPSQIFAVLAKRLSVSKGALLLYDPVRSVYAPWASTGFDTTTLHRLRIPSIMSESLSSSGNGRAVLVSSAEGISAYEAFFSSRELALVTRIILVPFLAAEKLLAILLITATDPPIASDEAFLTSLERIAGASSPAIQKAREDRISGGETRVETPSGTLEENLSNLLSSPSLSDKRILFFSLSLDGYQKRILEAVPYLDSFRLEEDLRFFMHSFTSDLGCTISLDKSTYLLGIQDMEKKDLDLFMHQLRSFLEHLFGLPDGDGSLSPGAIGKARYFPNEGDSVPGLVSFFST